MGGSMQNNFNFTDERDHKLKPLLDKIRIEESHEYCLSSGLDTESIWPMVLQGKEFNSFVAANSNVIAHCQQLFSNISRDFSDGYDLFALSDANARLINLHSCPEILSTATHQVGLSCGVLLSEASCGTNAVALALRYREPMIVSSSQNYCRLFQAWGAVAVPILGPDYQPLACIAILNSSNTALSEKLLLAKLIAKELEKFYVRPSAPSLVREELQAVMKPKPLFKSVPRVVGLTSRQHQVLQLFAQGMSYKQIAREIGISSFKTVEEHLDAIRQKLNVSHRRECIQKAISLGLI
jgi:transcriptional regulator of acetoin/glycerol metabolism